MYKLIAFYEGIYALGLIILIIMLMANFDLSNVQIGKRILMIIFIFSFSVIVAFRKYLSMQKL